MSYQDELFQLLRVAQLTRWELVARLDLGELRRRLAEAAGESGPGIEPTNEVVDSLRLAAQRYEGDIVFYQLPGEPTKQLPGRPSWELPGKPSKGMPGRPDPEPKKSDPGTDQ